MNGSLYAQLVALINEHRTWIEVAGKDRFMVHTIQVHCRLVRCVCRTLVLEAKYRNVKYRHTHRWRFPEYELDKALAAYRRKDPLFRARIKKGADRLTMEDAEQIIHIASHGMLNLRLSDL